MASAPRSTFADLGLSSEMLATLHKAQFETPSPIQAALIPVALEGRDCLGQAKTGTGKTAAFAIPMIERVRQGGGVQALVLVPTRELATQVGEHVRMLSARHPLKTLMLYGGTQIRSNLDRLKGDREIVVGTPGRVLDLISRRALQLHDIRWVVLDEVDRMLDIGFRDDIRKILRQITNPHQTIFVSATIDDEIRKLARTFMHDPAEINVSADRLTVDEIEQEYVTVEQPDKLRLLQAFIEGEKPTLVIVFTRTRRAAMSVGKELKRRHVSCEEIHGDLIQRKRDRVLKKLRGGEIQVLVATDLAARGIDVPEVSHIINYDIPEDPAVYVHRVGRTARMGKSGYALTFVTREQGHELTAIEMLINKEIKFLDAEWVRRALPDAPLPAAQPSNEHVPTPAPRVAKFDNTAGPAASRSTSDSEENADAAVPAPRPSGWRVPRTRRRGRR